MLFAPLLLTVATLRAIRWIILELFAMICRASLALAVRPAANNLIRVITGRLEGLSAIWAAGKDHNHPSHGRARILLALHSWRRLIFSWCYIPPRVRIMAWRIFFSLMKVGT